MAKTLMQYLNHFHNKAITGQGSSANYTINGKTFNNIKVANVGDKLKVS